MIFKCLGKDDLLSINTSACCHFTDAKKNIRGRLKRCWGVLRSKRHVRILKKSKMYDKHIPVHIFLVRLDLPVFWFSVTSGKCLRFAQRVYALIHPWHGVAIAFCNETQAVVVDTETETSVLFFDTTTMGDTHSVISGSATLALCNLSISLRSKFCHLQPARYGAICTIVAFDKLRTIRCLEAMIRPWCPSHVDWNYSIISRNE